MAENTTNLSWSSWSLKTKVTVGAGMAIAALLVVLLYLPR